MQHPESPQHQEIEAALAFLRQNTLAAVSTASKDGKPELAFVYFIIDDQFTFFFITRRDSVKFRNVSENPLMAAAVANEDDVKTVQLYGPVEEVTDEGEISRHTHMIIRSPKLAQLYMSNAPMKFLPPRVPEPDGVHFALLRLRPTWLRWMRRNPETDEPEFFTLIEDGRSA